MKKSKITFEIVEREDGTIDIVNPNIGADGTNGLNAGYAMGVIKSVLDYTAEWQEKNKDKEISIISDK